MTTVFKDRKGKVIRTESGTKYHPQGTGPRHPDGTLIVDAAEPTNADTTPTADDAADDARPATQKEAMQ